MTDQELTLLKASIDKVVVLKTLAGEQLAMILFIFDEGETPDLFYTEVLADADGSFKPVGTTGHSLLLAEVLGVRPVS